MSPIVICIPTYKRRDLLRRLLTSLSSEIGAGVSVIVADNGCEAAVKEMVEGFSHPCGPFIYVPVPERGLAAVRNAVIEAASIRVPGWTWLAMLDDDGTVSSGWLSKIIACGELYDADLLGGPVDGSVPATANIFARNSLYASRRRWKTGLVPTLNGAQGLVISRRLIQVIGLPVFRKAYDASGGEDYDLFRRAVQAQARIVWCDEAVVLEPTPPDRLTAGAVLARYYTTGMYTSQIDRSYDGAVMPWKAAFRGLARSIIDFLGALLRLNGDRMAASILSASYHLGRFAGLMGGRSARYAKEVRRT